MPTAYTAKIAEGISFRKYALTCARNFGVLIHMKNLPLDSKIPEKIEPNDYYLKKLNETKEKLEKIQSLSTKDANERIEKEYQDTIKAIKERKQENKDLKKKYEQMLKQAENYTVPTPEHINFRSFMIQQIKDSIEFDCNDIKDESPKKLNAFSWKDAQIKDLLEDIEYYQKKHAKEVKSAKEKTKWLQELFKSLEKEF